jgi:threonine dehydratase
MSVTMLDVLAARRRIAPWVRRTPLVHSAWLSRACGGHVAMKLESLQPTRSFKLRGAFNAALLLREQNLSEGAPAGLRLVTASTGNHGRALSYAAHALGMVCVVFAPVTTPAVKLDAIRNVGARLMADARDYDEAEAAALRYVRAAADTGVALLSPYNDSRIIAGTGTIAVEICEEDPNVDVVLVPIGGGGLISGIALAAKAIKPEVRVIGVEAAHNPVMSTARARGVVANIDIQPTLADALGGNNDPQTITFDYIRTLVDDIVLVSEEEIAAAVRDLAGQEQLVVEGAGAVTTAALAAKRIDVAGRRVSIIVSGSNIDRARFASIINHAA